MTMFMPKQKQKAIYYVGRIRTATLLIVFVLTSFMSLVISVRTSGQTIDNLQDKSENLQSEIESNKKKASSFHAHAATLQDRVDEISKDIAEVNKKINLLSSKIKKLKLKLVETIKELEKQKHLLGINIRAMYLEGDISTLEMLASSRDLSEFVDKEQYRLAVQDKVTITLETIIKLKHQISKKKNEVEQLLEKQEKQHQLLDSKREEQQTLLDETKGQEAKYSELVAKQQKELEDAEARLTRLLSGGNFVPLGPISRNEVLGSVGSTGFSTGAHLHFMVKKNGATTAIENPSNQSINIFRAEGARSPCLYTLSPWRFPGVECYDPTNCSPHYRRRSENPPGPARRRSRSRYPRCPRTGS